MSHSLFFAPSFPTGNHQYLCTDLSRRVVRETDPNSCPSTNASTEDCCPELCSWDYLPTFQDVLSYPLFFGKADNRKDLCNPSFCSTRSCNTPHISAAYTAHHNTDIFVYPFDLIVEYSGWFYISCPVIWKSLFRFAFVHTES